MHHLDAPDHLRSGIFLAPFHPVGRNPILALERHLDLIGHLDRPGFNWAWTGEHLPDFIGVAGGSIASTFSTHQAEPEARTSTD